MTHTETQAAHHGSGGLKLFLAFAGGAVVGGIAAVLLAPRSGAETRRRLSAAVGGTKDAALRMPQAFREASNAAQTAFAAALKDGA